MRDQTLPLDLKLTSTNILPIALKLPIKTTKFNPPAVKSKNHTSVKTAPKTYCTSDLRHFWPLTDFILKWPKKAESILSKNATLASNKPVYSHVSRVCYNLFRIGRKTERQIWTLACLPVLFKSLQFGKDAWIIGREYFSRHTLLQ